MKINDMTLHRDLYQSLINKKVVVYAEGIAPITGVLVEYSASLLKIIDSSSLPIYVLSQKVSAIAGEE